MRAKIWCPMKAEAKALKIPSTHSAQYSAVDIFVSVTGIGKKKSIKWVASNVHNKYGTDLDLLLIVGYGGALTEELKPGDVFIAEKIISAVEDGEIKTRTLTATETLIQSLDLPEVVTGSVYTSLTPVFSKSRRHQLAELGADVVDMESWWLTRDLPHSILEKVVVARVISDTPNSSPLKILEHIKSANASLKNLGTTLKRIR